MSSLLEREIGGRVWTVTLLPTGRGMDVGRRLIRLGGPAMGSLIGAVGPGGLLDADGDKLGTALGKLAEKFGEQEATDLVKELVTTGVFCDGKEVTTAAFETVFQGDYGTLIMVAAFVVEVNFKIPLTAWLTAVRARAADRKKSAELPRKPDGK